jgi:putative sterol carrier protein
MAEKLLFPSEEWIKDYCSVLSQSQEYNRLGQGWKDSVQFKITDFADKNLGLDYESFVLDLRDGRCERYHLIREDVESAPFVLYSSYSDWKRILEGKVNPTQAMLSGVLKVKGDMVTLLKYAAAATEMVKAAEKIETRFEI